MKKKSQIIILSLILLLSFFSYFQIKAQTLKAVNDTIDLYPGIPETVNLLENDTVPFGDSLKITVDISDPVNDTNIYMGFYTFIVKLLGSNGNLKGHYTIRDYTLGKNSTADILFRIHDHSYDSLDINNVKAAITSYGNQFFLPGQGKSLFIIPKESQKGTVYNSTLWIGGKGNDSILYLAAENHRQGPLNGLTFTYPDFYAGPVMDSANYSIYQDTVWSRVWKVKKSEIEDHIANWNSPGYKAPVNIFTWPGNGNPAYGQAARLAPYYDRNGDGIYNPSDGDYPSIRGDEAVFAIFNDDRGLHKETLGNKMRAEIHLMAYAFDMPDDSAFKNTIFFNYKIFNRSLRTYYSTYLGLWADMDIGYSLDDFIGCDVGRSSIIGYNGLAVDGFPSLGFGYGSHPPAQSLTILSGPLMDPTGQDRPRFDNLGHPLCNESINGRGFGDSIADNEHLGLTNFLMIRNWAQINYNTDPSTADEYYNNMQSIWRDSTHLFYGGMGHAGFGGYGPDCRFDFPGETDTLNWGTGCQLPDGQKNWTMTTANATPEDIRGIGGMGPFTFRSGDVQELDIAFVFARDYDSQDTLEPSVSKLRQMIDIVRNSYNTGKLPDGNSFFGIDKQPETSSNKLKIYPNPATNLVNIILEKPFNEMVKIKIINTSGFEVYSSEIINSGKKIQVDVSGLSSGMYIVTLKTKDFNSNGKLVIIR